MIVLKLFEEFIKEGIVKRITIDRERAKSLAIESERKLRSLAVQLEKIGINDENANDYVEYCYDIILYLIRAKLCLEGYSASGQGAHEAEVSYLRILGFDEQNVRFADQLRYFRNGILYYGTSLDAEYAKKVTDFTKKIYPKLKN
jgi:hypothetical protein